MILKEIANLDIWPFTKLKNITYLRLALTTHACTRWIRSLYPWSTSLTNEHLMFVGQAIF